jgi:hypothetical protein
MQTDGEGMERRPTDPSFVRSLEFKRASAPAASVLERGLVPIAPLARGSTGAAGGPILLTVQSIDGDIVVLDKPSRPLKRFQLGAVFGPGGEPIGRVVLDQE